MVLNYCCSYSVVSSGTFLLARMANIPASVQTLRMSAPGNERERERERERVCGIILFINFKSVISSHSHTPLPIILHEVQYINCTSVY